MDADFGEAFDKNDSRDVEAADRFMQVCFYHNSIYTERITNAQSCIERSKKLAYILIQAYKGVLIHAYQERKRCWCIVLK